MIFPHFGSHRLVQSSQFGFMAIIPNVVGCKFPKPITKSKDFLSYFLLLLQLSYHDSLWSNSEQVVFS